MKWWRFSFWQLFHQLVRNYHKVKLSERKKNLHNVMSTGSSNWEMSKLNVKLDVAMTWGTVQTYWLWQLTWISEVPSDDLLCTSSGDFVLVRSLSLIALLHWPSHRDSNLNSTVARRLYDLQMWRDSYKTLQVVKKWDVSPLMDRGKKQHTSVCLHVHLD